MEELLERELWIQKCCRKWPKAKAESKTREKELQKCRREASLLYAERDEKVARAAAKASKVEARKAARARKAEEKQAKKDARARRRNQSSHGPSQPQQFSLLKQHSRQFWENVANKADVWASKLNGPSVAPGVMHKPQGIGSVAARLGAL